jgi:hypothetical protein
MSELIQPMAMYMSTIPWPRLYHGVSRSRYYIDGRSIVALHYEPKVRTTLTVTAPFRFPLYWMSICCVILQIIGRFSQ